MSDVLSCLRLYSNNRPVWTSGTIFDLLDFRLFSFPFPYLFLAPWLSQIRIEAFCGSDQPCLLFNLINQLQQI